jgi:serine/threonine-protein kinase
MSLTDDERTAPTAPRLSDPTAVDSTSPFDSTERRVFEPGGAIGAGLESDVSPAAPRGTQLTSDPPTALVQRGNFRELPPGVVVGDTYEVDAKLGAGAMGEVYAAHHMKLGKRVAIKVIGQRLSDDDAAIERFAMEARTLAQIQHPAIVAIEHVGELADGRAYFVMEFLRGESLFERLQRGRLPLPEALRVLDQMARGLEAAHAEGVTHRDLKPENTFLVQLPGEPPAVKLVDFGLAKLAADRADVDRRAERTQSGVAIGTPMYMSPEQARGPDVDHRTDIYALGCVAYELLLGVPPFPHARTAPELYAAHLAEAPPLPRSIWPEIPPQLDLALFAMLAKDPAHRPTLAQVRSVLTAVRTDAPLQRAATEFVGPRAPRAGRRTLMIAGIVLAALVGGIAIGSRATPKPRDEDIGSIAPVAPPTPTAPVAQPDRVAPAPPLQPPPQAPQAPPQQRNTNSGGRPIGPRQSPKDDNPVAVPAAPIDAGVNVVEAPPPPLAPIPPKAKPSVDRNQTINPFAKKRSKVTP